MVDVNLVHFALLESKLGNIILVARGNRLIDLDITSEDIEARRKKLNGQYPGASESLKPFHKLVALLEKFVRRERVDFDVPFDLGNISDFSRRVLLEVKEIPYGTVRNYGSIGRRLGYPSAAQAVGQAVGKNPIPIVIPCHRVIRSDGTLGGFGMGLRLKEQMLSLEGVTIPLKRSSKGER
jgi:methylated-DNA-[protein]-cysteine S-methyltransferase